MHARCFRRRKHSDSLMLERLGAPPWGTAPPKTRQQPWPWPCHGHGQARAKAPSDSSAIHTPAKTPHPHPPPGPEWGATTRSGPRRPGPWTKSWPWPSSGDMYKRGGTCQRPCQRSQRETGRRRPKRSLSDRSVGEEMDEGPSANACVGGAVPIVGQPWTRLSALCSPRSAPCPPRSALCSPLSALCSALCSASAPSAGMGAPASSWAAGLWELPRPSSSRASRHRSCCRSRPAAEQGGCRKQAAALVLVKRRQWKQKHSRGGARCYLQVPAVHVGEVRSAGGL